ncbi:MAG: type II toxin-antitoxin system HicA family toxin [Nitrospinota bacterium]
MTEKLPALTPRRIIEALERGGFSIEHQTASHLRHPGPPLRRVVVHGLPSGAMPEAVCLRGGRGIS